MCAAAAVAAAVAGDSRWPGRERGRGALHRNAALCRGSNVTGEELAPIVHVRLDAARVRAVELRDLREEARLVLLGLAGGRPPSEQVALPELLEHFASGVGHDEFVREPALVDFKLVITGSDGGP